MRRHLKVLGFLAALVLSAILGSVGALAVSRSHSQVVGAASPATVTVGQGISQVKAVTDSPNTTTSSTTYVDMPGMKTTITVPSTWITGLILAHFSDESACIGGTAGAWCSVRILVDGVEAAPGDGFDYAFDTSNGGTTFLWGGHALDRSIVVGPGTHTVDVQWAVLAAGMTAWSGERSLIVERAKIS